ncbi:cyclophilin-like fold protein [Methanothermobacter wolfeii]|uniref:Cyclophilin-like fold protein n=1 Tax=Methanothermobacter wolfeii TaxID=145261 RepID=A0ABU8TUS3_METWO
MRIRITVEGKGQTIGELDDRNPESARRIYESLPIEGRALLWMEEVYFDIPVTLDYENPSGTASPGDISYWPPGYALCIFFGSTQPYSEVNHIGRVMENLELFSRVDEGDRIIIEKI